MEEDEMNNTDPTAGDPAPHGADPAANDPEPHGTDWKAEAQKWEKRAKANKAKADKWDASGKDSPALEDLQKQVAGLRAEAEAAKAEAARQSLLSSVSAATGVPAALIKGETEEEMTASAKAVCAFAESKGAGFPSDKGGGAGAKPLSEDDIEKIRDPVARIKARAASIQLNM